MSPKFLNFYVPNFYFLLILIFINPNIVNVNIKNMPVEACDVYYFLGLEGENKARFVSLPPVAYFFNCN